MNNIEIRNANCFEGNHKNQNGFWIEWSADCGFGEFTFKRDIDGKWTCDDECMSRESVKKVLDAFFSQVIMDSEKNIMFNGEMKKFDELPENIKNNIK